MRHGFLLIDKPAGMTSHDVVASVRRSFGEQDVGHLGTLDPAATGLLVLAVGRKALKVIELFTHLSKEYEASIRFGVVSTTYDGEGVLETIVPPMGWTVPEQAIVQRALTDKFIGTISQVPPAHSAVHVSGERAYRRAMRGEHPQIPPRDVQIFDCSIQSYAYPDLRLHVACSSGTYIRSLAHDLGHALRCGGYLAGLRRTKVGEWDVSHAVDLDHAAWAHVYPLKDVLAPLPRFELSLEQYEDARCGRVVKGTVNGLTIGWHDDLPVALLESEGKGIHARKVL